MNISLCQLFERISYKILPNLSITRGDLVIRTHPEDKPDSFFSLFHPESFFSLFHPESFFSLSHPDSFFSLSHPDSFFSLFHPESFFSLSHPDSFFSLFHGSDARLILVQRTALDFRNSSGTVFNIGQK